ncbi:MAG: hypothetical protein RQ757_01680 [Pseudomonadales bacterium]|nr:hypothetical protein [Pseudomonadales bacterium]
MIRIFMIAGMSAALLLTAAPAVTAAADEKALVGVWEVKRLGSPPFKRVFRELPATDIAALEIEPGQVETQVVWQADFSGRPPFKRRFREVSVIDIASIEISSETEVDASKPRRPKTYFKRHR